MDAADLLLSIILLHPNLLVEPTCVAMVTAVNVQQGVLPQASRRLKLSHADLPVAAQTPVVPAFPGARSVPSVWLLLGMLRLLLQSCIAAIFPCDVQMTSASRKQKRAAVRKGLQAEPFPMRSKDMADPGRRFVCTATNEAIHLGQKVWHF